MASKVASLPWQSWFAHSGLGQICQALTFWHQTVPGWASTVTSWGGWASYWAKGSLLCQNLDALALAWAVVLFASAPYIETTAIGAILAVGLGLWLLMTWTRPLQLTPITLAVLAFWGITTVATLCSPLLTTSFYGWSLVTLYVVGFALTSRVAQKHSFWLVLTYLVTVAIVGAEGLQQWRNGAAALATWVDQDSPLRDTTRIYSYLGNPNLLAAYLLPAVPLGVVGAIVWKPWYLRIFGGAMALLAVFCIGLTYSRGGWLALAVELLGLLLLGMRYLTPKFRLALLSGAASLGTLAILLVPALQLRLLSIFSGRSDSSNNFRITVWNTVSQMISDHFWLGIGPGNRTFEAIYPYYQRAGYNALGAYSVPLETWVELGLVGLVIFGWMLLVIWAWGVRLWFTAEPERAAWCAACVLFTVAILVQGLFDTVWYRPQIQTLWWLGVALLNAAVWPYPSIVIEQGK